ARARAPRLHVRALPVVDLLLDGRRLARDPRRRPAVDEVRQGRRSGRRLTVVTGRGEIIETDGPTRALRGPNWTQLICGSEGTLGVITSARLRLSPAPQLRVFRGFEVDDVAAGVAAIRRVLPKGLPPA